MKILLPLSLAGCLAAALLSTGCNTAGHQKADSTATNMEQLRKGVVALKEKVSAAASSLASVVEKAETDPKPAFDKYKKDVSALESGLSQAESSLKTMKSNGQAYFADWEQQNMALQDPDMKKSAEERRMRLTKSLDSVSKAMEEARAEIGPYMATLKDVQTYLGNDLTPSGIGEIKGKSKQVREERQLDRRQARRRGRGGREGRARVQDRQAAPAAAGAGEEDLSGRFRARRRASRGANA
jgi:hypothetical protein